MRQSLVLILILAALVLMPKERAGRTDPIPTPSPSPAATPVPVTPTAAPYPPVAYFGDSVTAGAWVSTPDKMYVLRLYKELERRGIDPTNDATWSFNPYSDLINARKIASQNRKWIFVELGAHWEFFNPSEFREVYGAMMDCLTGGSAHVIAGTIPWLNWSLDDPHYSEMKLYSQIIREEAAKRGVPVADLWAYTDSNPDSISRPGQHCFVSTTCEGDNFHPGDIGHALIAAAFASAIDEALASPLPHGSGRCDFDPYLNAIEKGQPIPLSNP